jgi:hypothetical protein
MIARDNAREIGDSSLAIATQIADLSEKIEIAKEIISELEQKLSEMQ